MKDCEFVNLSIPLIISSNFQISIFDSSFRGQKSQIVGIAKDDGKISVPYLKMISCDLQNTEFNGFLFNNVKNFLFHNSNISGENKFKFYRNNLRDSEIKIRIQFFFNF